MLEPGILDFLPWRWQFWVKREMDSFNLLIYPINHIHTRHRKIFWQSICDGCIKLQGQISNYLGNTRVSCICNLPLIQNIFSKSFDKFCLEFGRDRSKCCGKQIWFFLSVISDIVSSLCWACFSTKTNIFQLSLSFSLIFYQYQWTFWASCGY